MKTLLDGAANASVEHWGYIEDRNRYLDVLRSADCAVSTSVHDFQGLSMLEAAATGCSPLVPQRLAYPELFRQEFLYKSNVSKPEFEARSLLEHLKRLAGRKASHLNLPTADVFGFAWQAQEQAYLSVFESVAACR